METFKVRCWSMYYHIYIYLKTTRDLHGAQERWSQKRVNYFWNWILENEK